MPFSRNTFVTIPYEKNHTSKIHQRSIPYCPYVRAKGRVHKTLNSIVIFLASLQTVVMYKCFIGKLPSTELAITIIGCDNHCTCGSGDSKRLSAMHGY